jgi:DnaK suppressor protein
MTKDTNEIKTKLEKEKLALEKELSEVAQKNPNIASDWEAKPADDEKLPADENVLADNINDYESNNAVVNKLEPRLNDIKTALEKINKGTYGKCEICDKNIDDERLEANPAARTCREHMN